MRSGVRTPKKNIWILCAAVFLFVVARGKQAATLLHANKLVAPLLSMFASIGAYAMLFPFEFALGLVVMLLVHEAGHVWAAKRKGLPVTAPLFIPFVGALVMMKKHPRDAATEAYIALGGPLLGTAGAFVTYMIGIGLQSERFVVIGEVGFLLNLLNLLPIYPLDGGKIAAAITRWLWIPGIIGGLVLVIWLASPLLFIVWLLFTWELVRTNLLMGSKQLQIAVSTIDLSLDELTLRGALIPGEDHRRELPFVTYSTLDGSQKIRVRWEAVGMHEVIRMPGQVQGWIHKVAVTKIEHVPQENPDTLRVQCQIDYEPHYAESVTAPSTLQTPENSRERYFSVPAVLRWKYGTTYAALCALLLYLLI